jgi:hypothetical protein
MHTRAYSRKKEAAPAPIEERRHGRDRKSATSSGGSPQTKGSKGEAMGTREGMRIRLKQAAAVAAAAGVWRPWPPAARLAFGRSRDQFPFPRPLG